MRLSPIMRQADRPSVRQADRISLSFFAVLLTLPIVLSVLSALIALIALTLLIVAQQARPARSAFGRAAPFCALMAGGDTG